MVKGTDLGCKRYPFGMFALHSAQTMLGILLVDDELDDGMQVRFLVTGSRLGSMPSAASHDGA